MNRVTFSVVAIMLLAAATTLPFVLNAGFGKAPQGAQLSQVEASPHYRDGQFHNQLPTPGFTGQKNMLAAWWDFLMTKRENARPAQPLPRGNDDRGVIYYRHHADDARHRRRGAEPADHRHHGIQRDAGGDDGWHPVYPVAVCTVSTYARVGASAGVSAALPVGNGDTPGCNDYRAVPSPFGRGVG